MSIAVDQASSVERVGTTNHRIVIGPELVHDGDYYLTKLGDGSVLLTPVDSVPEEERAVWENPRIRESLGRAMEQAARGEVIVVDDLFDDLDEE